MQACAGTERHNRGLQARTHQRCTEPRTLPPGRLWSCNFRAGQAPGRLGLLTVIHKTAVKSPVCSPLAAARQRCPRGHQEHAWARSRQTETGPRLMGTHTATSFPKCQREGERQQQEPQCVLNCNCSGSSNPVPGALPVPASDKVQVGEQVFRAEQVPRQQLHSVTRIKTTKRTAGARGELPTRLVGEGSARRRSKEWKRRRRRRGATSPRPWLLHSFL